MPSFYLFQNVFYDKDDVKRLTMTRQLPPSFRILDWEEMNFKFFNNQARKSGKREQNEPLPSVKVTGLMDYMRRIQSKFLIETL